MVTIHPRQIESELDRIWESLQGTNKMRACLFNLIIYSKKSQRTAYLNQIAQNVIEKFPSRIIFITYDGNNSDYQLKTSVSVLAANRGKNEIACDLIEIDVCNEDQIKIPFVMLPHILPDLPIYLVHADDPIQENPTAKKLEYFASRIIFDSEVTNNLPDYARTVLKHYALTKADIADLNWARIEGWRQLFANVFQPNEDLENLQHATEIHIYFNSQNSQPIHQTNIQSIYLQAWIASQLHWQLVTVTQNTLTYEYANQRLQVHLHSSNMANISVGRITAITIQTASHFHYSMKRNPTCPHHVIIEKSNPHLCSLPSYFVFDKDDSGQSLVKEICHKGTSQHYMNMLKMIAEIKSECLYQ